MHRRIYKPIKFIEGIRQVDKTKMWIAEAFLCEKLCSLGEFLTQEEALSAYYKIKDSQEFLRSWGTPKIYFYSDTGTYDYLCKQIEKQI